MRFTTCVLCYIGFQTDNECHSMCDDCRTIRDKTARYSDPCTDLAAAINNLNESLKKFMEVLESIPEVKKSGIKNPGPAVGLQSPEAQRQYKNLRRQQSSKPRK